MSLGRFLSNISQKAHSVAEEERTKQDESRKAEIGVWQKVLEDPAASEEQRKKAVDTLNKLYNWKGKGDSPFQKFAGFMSMVGKRLQSQGPGGAGGGQPQPTFPESNAPSVTKAGGVAEGAAPQGGGEQPKAFPALNAAKRNVGEKALGKVASGLGAGLGAVGNVLNPHPPALPPLDASAFPTGQQQREAKAADIKSELEAKWPYEEKRIRLQEELREKTAASKARNAMASKEKYLGQDMINALPETQRQGLLDANNIPVDPNGVYGPATGDHIGLATDAEGKTYLAGVRVGTGPAREGATEQYVYDPVNNRFSKEKMAHSTKPPEPPKVGEKGKREFPGLKETKPSGGKAPGQLTHEPAKTESGKDGKEGKSGKIPLRVFPGLQKQTNAIHEARNSLVGDKPGELGGIARDIEIFKNPDSVDRVGQYIKFVNSQLEEQGKMATSMGPMAAVEWYTGLPSAVSNLQQEATAQYSKGLDDGAPDGPEHQFIADYYRLLGTWGGMRAATGASAAKWSFKNLVSEIPTPGYVTSYPEAQRRIENMANESNVVSKTNPMVEKIKVDDLYPKSTPGKKGVIKWGKDKQGNPVKLSD